MYYWSDISGLEDGSHFFNVHEFGDVSNNCENVGERFNHRKVFTYYNDQIFSENGVEYDKKGNYNKLSIGNVNILGRSIVIQLKANGDANDGSTTETVCASIVQVSQLNFE